MRWRALCLLLALALLAVVPAGPVAGRAEGSTNIRGIHTLVRERDRLSEQLRWARAIVGEGGYVTQPFFPIDAALESPPAAAVDYVDQAYALGLNPILRLQTSYTSATGCTPEAQTGWLRPTPDPVEGTLSFREEAQAYRRFVAGLPRRDDRVLMIQVGNEPNLHESWGGTASAAEYARFLVDVSSAIRELGDPRIKLLNAGLAPGGDLDNLEFIEQALTAEPAFASSFDLWASHPYPHNQPPEHNLHDGTAVADGRFAIDAYLLELDVLARHGVAVNQLGVVLTETGYALGDAWFGQYPPITEEQRADYLTRAFDQYWSRWPEVRAVTPFQLVDSQGSWAPFEWVARGSASGPSGLPTQPHLQYARRVPGLGLLRGVVTDSTGKPLQAADVRAEPAGYLATSLSDGSYILLAPPGQYRVTASKAGYTPPDEQQIEITAGGSALNLTLARQAPDQLQNWGFESDELAPWSAWGEVDGVQAGPWFFDITALEGQSFLGTAVNCGVKNGGVYQTVQTVPGARIGAEVAVLTHRDGVAPIGGRIGIDPTGGIDPGAGTITWSDWIESTATAWQLASLSQIARGPAATIFLEHRQDAANAWNVVAFDRVRISLSP